MKKNFFLFSDYLHAAFRPMKTNVPSLRIHTQSFFPFIFGRAIFVQRQFSVWPPPYTWKNRCLWTHFFPLHFFAMTIQTCHPRSLRRAFSSVIQRKPTLVSKLSQLFLPFSIFLGIMCTHYQSTFFNAFFSYDSMALVSPMFSLAPLSWTFPTRKTPQFRMDIPNLGSVGKWWQSLRHSYRWSLTFHWHLQLTYHVAMHSPWNWYTSRLSVSAGEYRTAPISAIWHFSFLREMLYFVQVARWYT